MLKKTIERTHDLTRKSTTITTTYCIFGKALYVRVVDYSVARDFPNKA